MSFQSVRFFCLTAVLLQCFLGGALQAAPQLDLRQQDRARLSMDVRTAWQTAMVPEGSTPSSQPLDAQTVWDWPDSQLKSGQKTPVTVKDGERLVGRWSMLVGYSPHSLLVELPMPRLDRLNLSYRYNQDAWTQVTAGDQVPMVKWPFANRAPVFVIAPKAGDLQMVIEVPVSGLFPSPVILWGDPAFREEQIIRNLEIGVILALAFISLLICSGAAIIFRRFVFVALGLYSISIFLVTGGQGGVFGMYIGTGTTWFNDYVKYISAALFGAIIPWTISVVVSQKHYSRATSRCATVWLSGSLMAVLFMLVTVDRATQWALLSPFLIASLIFALGIAVASVLRGQQHGMLSLVAVLLLCAGTFVPVASYWGYVDGTLSFTISSLTVLLSTTSLLLASLLQYRHGNRVVARAERSGGRDALTGLLNRGVFEARLGKIVREAAKSNSNALFLYIAISDREALEEQFGGEGFESGMVQMAAALSSSISVVDTVARLSASAFGVLVVMAPDIKLGNALAQKIITRTMAVASHSAPMAQTARIALAWVPECGRALPELEMASRKVLQSMEDGKRIGWLGGAFAHDDIAQKPGSPQPTGDTRPNSRSRADEMNRLINGVEDSMRQEAFAAINQKASRTRKVSDRL
jgi:GGDEF domain-containing protein